LFLLSKGSSKPLRLLEDPLTHLAACYVDAKSREDMRNVR
jgi:hypothetical protein